MLGRLSHGAANFQNPAEAQGARVLTMIVSVLEVLHQSGSHFDASHVLVAWFLLDGFQ